MCIRDRSGLYLNTTLTYAYDRVDAESYMEIDSSKYYIDGLDSAHYEIPTVAGPSIKNREVFSWQANARWSVFPWLLINGQFMTEWNDGKNVSTYSMGFLSQILQDILTIRGNVSYNYRFPSMNDLYWRPGAVSYTHLPSVRLSVSSEMATSHSAFPNGDSSRYSATYM